MTAPKRDGTEKNPSTEKEEELEIEDPQVRSGLTAVEVLTCILEVAHGEAMVVGGTAVNAGIKTRKSRDIDVDIPEQYTTTGKEDAIRKAVWEQGGKVTRLRKHSVTAILRSGTGNTTIGLSIRAKPCSIKTRRGKEERGKKEKPPRYWRIGKMRRLQVYEKDSPCDKALTSALKTIREAGGEPNEYWLGGGATLAARWHHRKENSIDLFTQARPFEVGLVDNAGLPRYAHEEHRIRNCLTTEQRTTLEDGLGWSRWETGHGRVGIFASYADERHGPVHDAVDPVHGLRIESVTSTLRKKWKLRWLTGGVIHDRDLVDLVGAAVHAPETTLTWWEDNDRDDAEVLAEEIRHLAEVTANVTDAQRWLYAYAAELIDNDGKITTGRTEAGKRLRQVPLPARAWTAPGMNWGELCPESDFAHETLQQRNEPRASKTIREYTLWKLHKSNAGHPYDPDDATVQRWLDEAEPNRLNDTQRGWLSDAMSCCNGIEAMGLRQSARASIHELARLAHVCDVQGLIFTGWLNQYAHRAHGRNREDVEAYGFAGLDDCGA